TCAPTSGGPPASRPAGTGAPSATPSAHRRQHPCGRGQSRPSSPSGRGPTIVTVTVTVTVTNDLDVLLQRNRAFARTDAKTRVPQIPFIPHQQLYVITCVDPRVDPAHTL